MAIVDSSNDSYIVGVTSSIGISLRESIGNLSEGVGISISLGLTVSFTFAMESTISTTIDTTISTTIDTTISTTIAKMSTVSNSTVARYSTMAIVDSSNDSYIVGVTSSIGISLRESIGNLSEGVGISFRFAMESTISTTIDTTISTTIDPV